MFVKMWFMNNLLFCVLVGQVTAQQPTELETRMLDYLNGKYKNFDETSGPNSSQDRIRIIDCPVRVPDFSDKVLIFFLEEINGKTTRVRLRSAEEKEKGSVTMDAYNITTPNLYKWTIETFNKTEVENLKKSEITPLDGCSAQFQFDDDHFVGGWEDCGDSVNGVHPSYGLNIYCYYYSANIPEVAPEKHVLLPYELRTTDKFDLINAPAGFKRCSDTQTG